MDRPAKPMRVGIIGGGVVGTILATCLSSRGHNVVLAEASSQRRRVLGEVGLRITGTMDRSAPCPVLVPAIEGLVGQDLDLVFITTKVPVMRQEVEAIADILREGPGGVIMQNGLGNEDFLAQHVPGEQVFRVVVNYAGGLQEDGVVNMTFFHRPNFIGPFDPSSEYQAEDVAALLTEVGLDTTSNCNIKVEAWKKSLLNAALSAMCALTNQTMKQAMSLPETAALTKTLLQEGIEVADAWGIDLGEGFLDRALTYLSTAGDHRPSTWVDLQLKTETEIDFLNGKIVEYAHQQGIKATVNEVLHSLIKGYEQANR